MVLSQIDVGTGNVNEVNIDLKEKNDAIRDSLTFDFPILFKANSLSAEETQKTNPLQTKPFNATSSSFRSRRRREHVTLSWENVNVFKKNEFNLKKIFKISSKTRDSSYLLHKDNDEHKKSMRKQMLLNGSNNSTVKTISFTRNNNVENQSLESLSSNSSTTSSASSSLSSSSKILKQIKFYLMVSSSMHIYIYIRVSRQIFRQN